ncbi:MAG: hypothetical protein JST87_15830 [Bacteroidetes bacterium]|nr:hypothetical protein [Bacteroidota bacterium]
MLFYFTIALCIATAIVSLVSFILYVQARMKELESEKKYQSIHFISLFIFVVLGVLALIMLSNMNL